MPDHATALQEAVFKRVASAVAPGRVFAHPPQEQVLPFTWLGEYEDEQDVDNSYIFEFEVHSYSSAIGGHEVKALQQTIYDALHFASLVLSGWHLVFICQIRSNVTLEGDMTVWHGVQRFRGMICPQ